MHPEVLQSLERRRNCSRRCICAAASSQFVRQTVTERRCALKFAQHKKQQNLQSPARLSRPLPTFTIPLLGALMPTATSAHQSTPRLSKIKLSVAAAISTTAMLFVTSAQSQI